MKIDPWKHKEKYLIWQDKVKDGIPTLSKENSEIILKYLGDMEKGLNIAKGSVKGSRSYLRLSTLKEKLLFFSKKFKILYGLDKVTDVSEEQLISLFSDMRNGILKKSDGGTYKSLETYGKVFKAFWHWHQKTSKKLGIEIQDITCDLDARQEKPDWVYLTEDEIKKLCDAAKFEYKVLIMFLFDTGIRAPTELVNIRVSDFFDDFKELLIREEISKTFGRRIKLMFCSNLMKKSAKVESNDTLSGIIKMKSLEIPKSNSSPPEYFYLTSVCDPHKEYIVQKFPQNNFEKLSEKSFIIGRKLHSFADRWFKGMSNFISSESVLDGFYLGIKAKGKIDARIGDSIVELKTKNKLPETSEEVFRLYSRDVEQLAFYSVLDPLRPKINYLVFMTQIYPYKFKVFKMEIKDHNKIDEILKKRINNLRGVLLDKINPSILGKCRYCYSECNLKKDGLCKPENLFDIGCEVKDYLILEEDISFKDQLEKSIESLSGNLDFYTIFNILAPRKYFNKYIKEIEDKPFESNPEEQQSQDYFNNLIFNLDLFKLDKNDFSKIPEPIFPKLYFPKSGWIKLREAGVQDGKIIPFIAHSSTSKSQRALQYPSDYKIAELGIATLMHGKTRGLILMFYPYLGNQFKVFDVNFSFEPICKQRINEILKILDEKNINNFQGLPFCPIYIHNSCSYKNECYPPFESKVKP